MSCVPDDPRFRLLDAYVGWDPETVEFVSGLKDPAGITLQPTASIIDPAVIARAIPPAWLAMGCRPCEWHMVTCCPPRSRVMRLDPCNPGWYSIWVDKCAPNELDCGVAIAVYGDRTAVSDSAQDVVWIWRDAGAQLALEIPVVQPGPIAWSPAGMWLIADHGQGLLRRFDRGGSELSGNLPLPGRADRMHVDSECTIWLVTYDTGEYRIWTAAVGDSEFDSATLEDLLAAFPDTGLHHASDHEFCIEDTASGQTRMRCFDCLGREIDRPPPGNAVLKYAKQGQLLTVALDSGIPRCRWHRVRIDADVPNGTTLDIAVSTQEAPTPDPQGLNKVEWQAFAAGIPHPDDWQSATAGATDYLIDQPSGRYLFVRIRMAGDGYETPRVRRIRLDFPRRTSLDDLPAVYRENPGAADFSERFLSLFDAAIEDIDRAIERNPALLDIDGVPEEVLPWLGSFLDVVVDPSWDVIQRRRILNAIPELYKRRGTVEGLRRTIELLFGVELTIQEAAMERMWGALGESALNGVRLLGRSTSRMRVGVSPLGAAPVRSFGDPNLDPLTAQAFRFSALVPPTADTTVREQSERVVNSQKPAHTAFRVVNGGDGFIVGSGSRVEIDTAIVPLPPPVIGDPTHGVRLNRQSILWSGPRRGCAPTKVGETTVV